MTNERDDQGADDEALSFEQAMQEADQIVRNLEDGALSLADSLKQFERGVGLLATCSAMLQQAELKICQLVGVDEQGRPLTAEFDALAEPELEQKARSRSRRRSASKLAAPTPPESQQSVAEGRDRPDSRVPGGPENQSDGESVDESRGLF